MIIPEHNHLIPERSGKTRRVVIAQHKIYLITGEFDDGTLGEIFIRIDKEGSELRVYDALAIAISIGLQHGIPLETFAEKLCYQKFEPAGVTNDTEIPLADSIVDYIFKKLTLWYGKKTEDNQELKWRSGQAFETIEEE